ncbi:MAG: glutathione S-transferase family protein [Alphaproteobacteria bacterium]
MGLLVNGSWFEETRAERAEREKRGKEIPDQRQFRSWVTAGGGPAPDGSPGYPAAAGRYHLYVCHACPWAHRTMIARSLKGLDDAIGVSVVNWFMGEQGWTFEPGDGVVADPIWGVRYLHELYSKADPAFTGRVSVPVLFDLETKTIVSNESSEILRMFGSAFDAVAGNPDLDLYPEPLRATIDAINDRVFDTVNAGVYKAGFAIDQAKYARAATAIFETFDWLEKLLAGQRYVAGDRFTEADIRLFTTLLRFDPVYHGHFKCNLRRLVDYPNLWGFTREVYQMPGVAETVDLTHIQHHYYESMNNINPTRIVPIGPDIDFTAPHDRDRLHLAA